MMQHLFKKLPDDNPITAISVIEDISTPPPGFFVVSKTHDQDCDADLWRGCSFFGGKVSRYLCLSKEEKIADYIVENIAVIGEKDVPPDGYCLIPKTIDTDAKAWKKRQICYSLTRRYKAVSAVTDVILLSKNRKAPQGFKLAGDINGMAVCFKVNTDLSPQKSPSPALGYSLNPNGVPFPEATRKSQTKSPSNGMYPIVNTTKPMSPNDEYVNLLIPKRKAPPIPVSPGGPSTSMSPPPLPQKPVPMQNSYGTLGSHQGLEGIPFVLHPTIQMIAQKKPPQINKMRFKTQEQINEEAMYIANGQRTTIPCCQTCKQEGDKKILCSTASDIKQFRHMICRPANEWNS